MSDVDQLANRLRAAADAYYNGSPILSDAAYDSLEAQLRELEPNHPVLLRVGAPVPKNGAWPKVRHEVEMGSLNKAQTEEELATWWGRINDQSAVVSEKLDGISCSLKYVDGRFVQALTRGDGVEGEDITRNVVEMEGVVHTIPNNFTGHVRGEIVCRRSVFREYFGDYANPRNTAAGKAKKFDGDDHQRLTLLAYRVTPAAKPFPTKSMEFAALQRVGFMTPNYFGASLFEEVGDQYQAYVGEKRAVLDYDIDGLVVEVDDRVTFDEMGELNGRPAAAIAMKFPAESAQTKIQQIVFQVGPTGRITPVAEFDPVMLAGAEIKRASLHNRTIMEELSGRGELGFAWCDVVTVERKNDVIPQITEMVLQQNPVRRGFKFPTNCPVCGAALRQDGEHTYCRNDECSARKAGLVKIWIEKIGVLEWGDAIIDALFEQGFIENTADLYRLTISKLATLQLEGRILGESAAGVMFDRLHERMELPLHVFVGALGIPLCARTVCRTIVDAGYDTLEKMVNATHAELEAIPGIGLAKTESFIYGIRERATIIEYLREVGVRPVAPTVGIMTGKTVCFTGVRDPDLEAAFEAQGGSVKKSAVKGLSYLVAADPNSNSGKAKKARAQGTTIVGVDEMWSLLNA